jgi:hypothetical protein
MEKFLIALEDGHFANDLLWHVWVLSICLNFLTLLDSVEEHFRGFGSWEWATEQHIVVE